MRRLILLGAIVGATVLETWFVRLNLTPSVPEGLYWRTAGFHRAEIVEFCPPDAVSREALDRGFVPRFPFGPCYAHSMVFMKVLAAVGGDVVDVSPAGIAINGATWPGAARRYFAHDGTPIAQWMPYGRTIVPTDSALVLGTNPESFDGRVWGLIKVSAIRGGLTPIFTWKGY